MQQRRIASDGIFSDESAADSGESLQVLVLFVRDCLG